MISRTIEAPLTWTNSTLVAGDALDVVPRLKAESPVPLRCHGSIRMNRALLAAGLVDRLEVMVFPVITGESGQNPVKDMLTAYLTGKKTLDQATADANAALNKLIGG